MQERKRYMDKFKQYLINLEKSTATVDKYTHDVTQFLNWCNGRELTKALVMEYKKHLTENFAPRSVNSIISSLNCFFEYSKKYELKLKALKIQRAVYAEKEKELTKREYDRLLRTAQSKGNEKLYLIMQTICSTGIRVSELCFIDITAIKRETAVINNKGKIRNVFLPKELCKMLKSYAKQNKIEKGSIFITKTGKPLNRSNIWKMMKNLCDDAGVSKDKVFPHNLRHLFARTFYSLKSDIVRLADILGHSSIDTTRLYTMEAVYCKGG